MAGTAIRTTVEKLRAIIQTDTDTDLTEFIFIANILTDQVEDCAAALNKDLTEEQLEGIERYLAAHLYALQDQQYQSKSTERASASFAGKTDMGLDFTRFGQFAKILDTSGCLDSFGVRQHHVGLTWLGKPPSSQTDYVDRD